LVAAGSLIEFGNSYLYFPLQEISLIVLLSPYQDQNSFYKPSVLTNEDERKLKFSLKSLDLVSQKIVDLLKIDKHSGSLSIGKLSKLKKYRNKVETEVSLELCASLSDEKEDEDTSSGINQSRTSRRNQIICQTLHLKLQDVSKQCKGCKQIEDEDEKNTDGFLTLSDCDKQFVKNIVGTFAEKSNFLFLHSSNISSIGLIQSKINTCQETFKVVCESMPDKLEAFREDIFLENNVIKEDKSQLNLKCKIERNEVILKHFLKPVTYNFVSQDSNHPKPQEVNDLHIYKENIKNGQISLSLYNQEFHYWKSNYQFQPRCNFLKLSSFTSFLPNCKDKNSHFALNKLKICSSERNERVNFWNILFDVNQKQLDEKFLLTDSVNCTIETTDAKFSNVFNTKKQGNVTLLFYNTTKNSMKEKENHDVSFPIDTKSDVSIVRQPDIKLIIGTSWKKFARIGTFGKEVFQSNSSNTTDCNKNVSMSSLAAIGNILYLKEPVLKMGKDESRTEVCLNGAKFDVSLENKEECSSHDWCSSLENISSCQNSCHITTGQKCHWKTGEHSAPGFSSFLMYNYSTCTSHLDTCPDGQCDPLENMDPSLCPQDCVKTSNIRMSVLVNSGGSQGIQSVKTGNMTCKCDISSCQCFHSKYEDVSATEIKPSEEGCDDHCILFVTLCSSLVLALVLILTGVWARQGGGGICSNYSKQKKNKNQMETEQAYLSEMEDYKSENSTLVTYSTQHSSIAYHNHLSIDKKFEYPRQDLVFGDTLGEGQFGRVVSATAFNIAGKLGYSMVAVKMLRDGSSISDLSDIVTEYNLLRDLDHPNVIKLIGACTDSRGPFYLIIEYAEHGSLKNYLRDLKNIIETKSEESETLNKEDEFQKTRGETYNFAFQISKGMAYLEGLKVVHRDLATRNILLAEPGKVCKISDFGMSRDVYVDQTYTKVGSGKLPVKWMAPESLQDQVYTSKSDVWSYGVLLWELDTLGSMPYPGVRPESLLSLFQTGYRMEKPKGCPDSIYQLMLECWNISPNRRPHFKQIRDKMETILSQFSNYLDLSTSQYSTEMQSVNNSYNNDNYLCPN